MNLNRSGECNYPVYSGEIYFFDKFPDWKPDTERDKWEQEFSEFDTKRGYRYKDDVELHPSYDTKLPYSFKGSGEIADFIKFFDEVSGRWQNLWFPSWTNDLKLTAGINSGETVISVEDINYASYYPEGPGTGRHIVIYVNPNKYFVKKVTGVPSSTSLQLESGIEEDLTLSQVKATSFVYLGRLDTDDVEMKYKGKEVIETELFFKETPTKYSGEI
jgi:hypothetical protein